MKIISKTEWNKIYPPEEYDTDGPYQQPDYSDYIEGKIDDSEDIGQYGDYEGE